MDSNLRLRVILPSVMACFVWLSTCSSKPASNNTSGNGSGGSSSSSTPSSQQEPATTASPEPPPPPPPPPQKKSARKEPPPDETAPETTSAEAPADVRPSPSHTGPGSNNPYKAARKAAPPNENYAVMRVYYATDREPTGVSTPGQFYGGSREEDETLHLGELDVSIPRDHRMGSLERPSIWKLEIREDPEKHVVLLSVMPKSEQEFYTDVSNKVASSANKDVFVFIHGFDNTFEQAAWRTAQLAYDLGFQGAPIMYSWPSKGKLAAYAADESTIDWSTPHFQKFLETLAVQSHATTVHLIAHSMGNRALTRALYGIAQNHSAILPMFKHVFLAAPDIDVGVFRQLAATFPTAASHVTLYASSRDEAIVASERLHQFDRVGDSRHICVVENVDTIDASAVDTGLIGHAYFADKRSILTDMFEVIQTGAPPEQRFGMHAAALQQKKYWVLNP